MEKLVFVTLAITIASMIVNVDAGFFGDYDSIGSSGSPFQTISLGDNYAPHRSNVNMFGGGGGGAFGSSGFGGGNSDALLQNVHIRSFGLSRPHGMSGGSGNGRRNRGKKGKKSEKGDEDSTKKKEDDVIETTDKSKSDAKKKQKDEALEWGKPISSVEYMELTAKVEKEWKKLQERQWETMQKLKAERALNAKKATNGKKYYGEQEKPTKKINIEREDDGRNDD